MKEILQSIMRNNGIVVEWQDDNGKNSSFFDFQDLIEMKVNASDLIANPKNYRLDEGNMTLGLVCSLKR